MELLLGVMVVVVEPEEEEVTEAAALPDFRVDLVLGKFEDLEISVVFPCIFAPP